MKKFLISFLILTLLLSTSVINADERLSEEEMEEIKQLNNTSSYVATSYLRSKDSITVKAYLECTDPFWGQSYVLATTDSEKQADYLLVKIRIYDSQGAFVESAKDEANYTVHVGVKITKNEYELYNHFAYGNHQFKKSGYIDVNLETYDSF